MKKSAVVYLRGGKVLVQSQARLPNGALLADKLIAVLNERDRGAIGLAVSEALEAYRTGAEMPEDVLQDNELYLAAGVRGWRQFVSGTKAVGVKLNDNLIALQPRKNAGPRDGFIHTEGKDHTVLCGDPELGNKVMAAFKDAE